MNLFLGLLLLAWLLAGFAKRLYFCFGDHYFWETLDGAPLWEVGTWLSKACFWVLPDTFLRFSPLFTLSKWSGHSLMCPICYYHEISGLIQPKLSMFSTCNHWFQAPLPPVWPMMTTSLISGKLMPTMRILVVTMTWQPSCFHMSSHILRL